MNATFEEAAIAKREYVGRRSIRSYRLASSSTFEQLENQGAAVISVLRDRSRSSTTDCIRIRYSELKIVLFEKNENSIIAKIMKLSPIFLQLFFANQRLSSSRYSTKSLTFNCELT